MNNNPIGVNQKIADLIKRIRFKELPFDEEASFQKLKSRINRPLVLSPEKKYFGRIGKYASIAACLALMVGGWFVYNQLADDELIDYVASLELPSVHVKDVQLVLSEKKVVEVKGKTPDLQYTQSGQVNVNSETVDAVDPTSQSKEVTYNRLVVPVGKTSSITFSDGTKVWVNSESFVVYPVVFAEDKREIYVEGEVYLEVAHNEQKPFIVRTGRMDVRVLGTCFNVNAYKQNALQQVVLVQGKVEVKTGSKGTTIIHPNEMLSYNEGRTEVKAVDASRYISWKDGFYQYEKETLGNVINHLSKHFGIEIGYDKELREWTCSGKLDLKNGLADALKTLGLAAPIEITETRDKKKYINVKP